MSISTIAVHVLVHLSAWGFPVAQEAQSTKNNLFLCCCCFFLFLAVQVLWVEQLHRLVMEPVL